MSRELWVACSKWEFGHVGEVRHKLRKRGDLTTRCGAEATVPGVWRANSTKPKCKACEGAR